MYIQKPPREKSAYPPSSYYPIDNVLSKFSIGTMPPKLPKKNDNVSPRLVKRQK
jgi:hypothetical protein